MSMMFSSSLISPSPTSAKTIHLYSETLAPPSKPRYSVDLYYRPRSLNTARILGTRLANTLDPEPGRSSEIITTPVSQGPGTLLMQVPSTAGSPDGWVLWGSHYYGPKWGSLFRPPDISRRREPSRPARTLGRIKSTNTFCYYQVR